MILRAPVSTLSCSSRVLPSAPHSHASLSTPCSPYYRSFGIFSLRSPFSAFCSPYDILLSIIPSFATLPPFSIHHPAVGFNAFCVFILHGAHCIHCILPSILFISTVPSRSQLILHIAHCIPLAPFTSFSPAFSSASLCALSLYFCVLCFSKHRAP